MSAEPENERGDGTGRDAKNNGAGTAGERTAETKEYSVELINYHRLKAKRRRYRVRWYGLRPRMTLGNPKPTYQRTLSEDTESEPGPRSEHQCHKSV